MKCTALPVFLIIAFPRIANNCSSIQVGLKEWRRPAPELTEVKSPGGFLRFRLTVENRQLFMSVSEYNSPVVEKSSILFSINGSSLTEGIKKVKESKFSINETFPFYGLHSEASNNCNGVRVDILHTGSGVKYTLEIRVFDDAAAFRFIVPGDENEIRYPDEATVFRVPAGSRAWYHDLYMHYEGVHVKKLVDTVPSGQWAAPPLTYALPGNAGYASITEANLVNYPGMALQSDGNNGFIVRLGHNHPPSYPYVLRYSKEDVERLSKPAGIKGTITTPWRVIITGKELNTIVN